MKYSPHDYQKYAVGYIESHPIAAVLLDMGLGKTSITLTALSNLMFDSFEIHKILIVAPLRVAKNTWSAEIEKWDHLKILRSALPLYSSSHLPICCLISILNVAFKASGSFAVN